MRPKTSLLFMALSLACSPGGGGTTVGGGGIGGSGFSSGEITALGSIVVNEVHWSLDGAQKLVDDGAPAAPGDFQVGMVVTVEGTLDAGGATGKAISVEADDELEGPIASIVSIDADTVELTILGQKAIVERVGTLFDDSMPGFDFDTMMVDDLVEVHGFAGPPVFATRIELKGSFTPGMDTPAVEVKGVVSNVDAMAGTFSIGTLGVQYDPAGVGTDLGDMPGGQVMDGDRVEVHGTLLTSGALSADSGRSCLNECRIEPEGPFAGDADEFEIEGIVANFNTLADFEVAGQPVDASGATVEFEPASLKTDVLNDPASADGTRLEVEGSLLNGTVIARKVKQRSGSTRIAAEVGADSDVDLGAGTVQLLGIPVRVTAATRLEDELKVMSFGLDDIRGGDFIEIRGVSNGLGGVDATELKRLKETKDVRVRGEVETFDSGATNFTILGVVLETDNRTSFGGFPAVVDETDFYTYLAANPGAIIEAKDTVDANETQFDIADQVDLED